MYNGALAGARRIYAMENKEEGEETKKGNLELEKLQGHIVFEKVSFKYPTSKKPILKNISFNINPGQTIAIVGPTGSGKSSLTKLLLRLYEYEGTIKIEEMILRIFRWNLLENLLVASNKISIFFHDQYEKILQLDLKILLKRKSKTRLS